MSDTADREHLRSVARSGTLNLVGAAVTGIGGVVLTVLVTRLVARDTAGVFFTVTSLFLLLAMIGQLGSGTGLVYFVSRARTLGARGEIARYCLVAARPALVLSIVAAAALAVAAPVLAGIVAGGREELATALIRGVAVFLPLAVAAEMCQAVTRGYGTMRPTALVEKIGRPVVQIPLVAALAGAGGLALGAAWAVPYLPAAAVSLWWLLRLHGQRRDGAGATRRPIGVLRREYWRYSLPRALAGVAQMALQRLDIILVGALRGPVDAAVYAAATRFLVVGQLANQAIALAVQPRVAGLLAVDDTGRTNEVYRSSTAWLVLLAWPLYLLAAAFATEILLVFGDGYSAGREVIWLLAASMLVATGCGMVDVMLNMAGRTSWNLINVSVALAVNVVLCVLLVPPYGIVGAALAWAAAIVVKNALPLAQIWRTSGLHPFARPTLTAAAVATCCFGLPQLAVLVVTEGGWVARLAAALAGLVCYAVVCWRLRRSLDLDLLAGSLTRRLRR